jgi:hypothetical protein
MKPGAFVLKVARGGIVDEGEERQSAHSYLLAEAGSRERCDDALLVPREDRRRGDKRGSDHPADPAGDELVGGVAGVGRAEAGGWDDRRAGQGAD